LSENDFSKLLRVGVDTVSCAMPMTLVNHISGRLLTSLKGAAS